MPQETEDFSRRVDEIGDTLRRTVKSLGQIAIRSQLEAEIVGRLIDGKRTVTELVALIYDSHRDNQEFFAYYMRTKRAIRSLATRGMVSTNLFGRDRPYRLTRYAVEKLASIGGTKEGEVKMIPNIDKGLYGATLGLVVITVGVARWGSPDYRTMLVASCILFFFGGIAFTRAMQSIRRVF